MARPGSAALLGLLLFWVLAAEGRARTGKVNIV